jgi:type I restriction-modification system DNA methylase subunit
MTTQYTCDLCKKVFGQKIDFTRHQNKKTSCVTLEKLQEITQKTEEKTDIKTKLVQTFKACLNIMRDNEGLTGEKALRNLSYLLILKLIEPHIGNQIDIDGYEYDFEAHFEENVLEVNKTRILSLVRFSILAREKDDDIPVLMGYLWNIILSVHPKTSKIFLNGRGFDIKHKTTFKKLIEKLIVLDISNTNYDVLGNAYEEVIQDIMTGKVLGQFFTQPLIKEMMVKLIDPQIHADGKIDTCGDPTMGTGGFLITYLKHILKQATEKNIQPDWEFIKTEGLYGKELEPDTYQLAISNMLISSGQMFDKLDRGDSIRVPITRKFDNILANPPFGIKGLKYDDFESPLKSEYVPIKSDNAVSLFIQAIIYMLKLNGKCAVVLPDGQELFSKTNVMLIAIREYLMKTCDLKEIIYLPSGMFNYTTIKTCVFYFVKKREGTDVLETKIRISKTQKEVGRDYVFSKTHQTVKVKFYDYNPYNDVKNLLVEVPIERIASNSYALNYTEYLKDEIEEEQYEEEGINIKTLGEVCDFQNGSQLDKKDKIDGDIPIFGGGVKIVGLHNEANRSGNETIVCGTGYPGYVNHNHGKPFWASQCFTLKSKNVDILLDKYLYYYSKIVLEKEFMSKQKGTAQKFIRFSQIIDVKISIPTIEKQKDDVKYLDFIFEKANKTSSSKIAELRMLNEFCLNNQKSLVSETNKNTIKQLGEICEFHNGKNISKADLVAGEYPVVGGGKSPLGYHNKFNVDENTILISKDGAYAGFVSKYNKKVFVSGHGIYISNIKENYNQEYIYYYLKIVLQESLYKLQTGTAQPGINKAHVAQLKISIPTLEKQNEIVEYCKYNDELIKLLEKEIENNNKQAKIFISGVDNVEEDEDEEEVVELHIGEEEENV